jgi:tetratricopeptide (TPR) repeat protein
MSLTVKELVDKAIDQRRRGRHAEALLSAIAATELGSDNPDAWWQVSLNRWMLGATKLAVVALERTVQLAPHFAPAWARLGTARLKSGDKSDAFGAFKTALERDPYNEEALRGAIEVLEDFEKTIPPGQIPNSCYPSSPASNRSVDCQLTTFIKSAFFITIIKTIMRRSTIGSVQQPLGMNPRRFLTSVLPIIIPMLARLRMPSTRGV